MRLRRLLVALLVVGLILLLWLLPRSALLLQPVFSSLQRQVETAGYELTAQRVSGNLLTGLTLEGATLSGPGLRLSGQYVSVTYSLLSLLSGPLMIDAELAGVSGRVEAGNIEPGQTGSINLPVSLGDLSLSDIAIGFGDFPFLFPELSLTEVSVEGVDGHMRFQAAVLTSDGRLDLDGSFNLADMELKVNVPAADLTIANHWWPHVTGGQAVGTMYWSDGRFGFDATVQGGGIDFLEARVGSISGPVSMRDLVITGDLGGIGLGGSVIASTVVDIGGLTYTGELTADPRLEDAIAWLGRNLEADLGGITSEGRLHTSLELGGWESVWLRGEASGSGHVLDLPLDNLEGTYTYSTESSIGVDAAAAWSSGTVAFSMVPTAEGSDLSVRAAGVQPLPDAAPGLALDAEASLLVPHEPGQFRPGSTAVASLSGEVLGRELQVRATGSSDDVRDWLVTLSGEDTSGSVLDGSGRLDFGAGGAAGSLTLGLSDLPGVPWPVNATLDVPAAPLSLPLALSIEAQAGPVVLAQLPVSVDSTPEGGFTVNSGPDALSLRADPGSTTLLLSEPPLSVNVPGAGPVPVHVSGRAGSSGTATIVNLSAAAAGYLLEVTSEPGGAVLARLSGASEEASLRFGPVGASWEASGSVALEPLGDLLGIAAGGTLEGTARGAPGGTFADVAGDLLIAGLPLSVRLHPAGDMLMVEATAELAGLEWSVSGSLLPEVELAASSAIGTLELAGDRIGGRLEAGLPGVSFIADSGEALSTFEAAVTGSLTESRATVDTPAGVITVDWASGIELAGTLRQELSMAGLRGSLDLTFAPDLEATARLQLDTAGPTATGLTASGSLRSGAFALAGGLPAEAASELLGARELLSGDMALEGRLQLYDPPALESGLTWTGTDGSALSGTLAWQAGQQAVLELGGNGLDLILDGDGLQLELAGFEPAPFVAPAPAGLRLDAVANTSLQGSLDAAFSATLPGLAHATGTVGGEISAPEVAASLSLDSTLTGSDFHSLEPLDVSVTLTQAAGLLVLGEGTRVTLEDGDWQGELTLRGELLGEPHTLGATLAGPLLAPVAEVRMVGPLLNGEALWDGAELFVTARLARPLEHVSSAEVVGTLQPDGTWGAHLQATHPGFAGVAPLMFGAELDGDLSRLQGIGNVRGGSEAERLLTLSIEGGFDGAVATADLRSLDTAVVSRLLGVQAEATAAGTATVGFGSGGLGLTVQGSLAGPIAGADVDITFTGTEEFVQLQGRIANEQFEAGLSAAEPYSLAATWGAFELDVASVAAPEGTLLTATLLESDPAPVTARAAASLLLDADGAYLEELSASFGGIEAHLAGRLWPEPDAAGQVESDGLVLPIVLVQTETGPQLQARAADLALSAGWTTDGPVVAAAGSLEYGSEASLLIDLSWSPPTGFRGTLEAGGELSAAVGAFGWQLHATGVDGGALVAEGSLWREGGSRGPLVTAQARLDSDPLRGDALSGRISGVAGISDVLPGAAGLSLGLSTSLNLSGSVTSPELEGTVALTGALEATGRVDANVPAGVRVQLDGEGLELVAAVDQDGWTTSGQLTNLPLDGLTFVLPGGVVSLRFEGGSAPSGAAIDVAGVAVRSRNSIITGAARWHNGLESLVEAELEVAVDLEDLAVGIPLTGLATGSVSLSGVTPGSAELSGELRLSEVSTGGIPVLAGGIVVAGTPADPFIDVQLEDLADTGTTITLSRSSAGISASGSVGILGGTLEIGTTDDGRFTLTGTDTLEGWEASLDPVPFSAHVTGGLDSLSAATSGTLEAALVPGPTGTRLQGSLSGVTLAGIAIGDITLASEDFFGGHTTLSGPAISARLNTSGGWQVSTLELTLPHGVSVVASGSGELPGGNLRVSVAGALLDSPFTASITASGDPDRLSIIAAGAVLGGTFHVDARLIDRVWQGAADIAGLNHAGTELNASGAIHGSALSPRLELQSRAQGWSLAATGSIHVSPAGFEFHQTVQGGGLDGAVTVQGAYTSEPVLRITGPDGHSFVLEGQDTQPGSPVLDLPLRARGRLNVSLDGFTLAVEAAESGDAAMVLLSSDLLSGLQVQGDLDLSSLGAQLAQLTDGIELRGLGGTGGQVRLDILSTSVTLDAFSVGTPVGTLSASGTVRLDGSGRVTGELRPGDSALSLITADTVPFALVSQAGIIRLVSAGPTADLEAVFSLATQRGALSLFVNPGSGSLSAQLAFDPGQGLSGVINASELRLFELQDGAPALLSGNATLDGEQASGSASLTLGSGTASLSGAWGLAGVLPPWMAPRGTTGGSADLRVGRFEMDELPFTGEFAPQLHGNLTGVLQLRNRTVVGSFVAPDLRAGDTPLSFETLVSGTLDSIDLGGSISGSPFNLTFDGNTLRGLLEMRRFPLEALAEAVAGPLDVTAEVTGVVRFNLPVSDPASISLHVATELVRLERAGQVTTGNLSLELAEGRFEISEAAFEGAGSWTAEGVLTEERLDFTLNAHEADFGPMLGLIPAVAALNVDAVGSLSVRALGSLADPRITVSSEALDFRVAGIGYRLEAVALSVTGNQLDLAAELLATEPLQGRLSLRGNAGISLAPAALAAADFRFSGSLVVPFVGAIREVDGTISSLGAEPGAPLVADVTGNLGAPFRITGSLSPLELNMTGDRLLLDLPAVFLRRTTADVNLVLRENGGLHLGGDVVIEQGTLSFSQDPPVAGDEEGVPTGVAGAGPLGSLAEMLHFDGLTVRVPSRLRVTENFGTAELTGQVTVSGTLAEPLLSGRADTLRGNFQFVGRDFTLQQASVIFDPARGLLPALQFTAVTNFDRTRLFPQGAGLQLVAPVEGAVEVVLSFGGAVEMDSAGTLRLNVDPVLTSNAQVQQVLPGGTTMSVRSLTSDELLSLVAFGRIELDSLLAGETGLAPAVAQGAIETAVDMLILAELQRALSESLGIDLVEIRSGVISELLTGNQPEQFGVSLRLGGYVTDEVFATYRVSAFDDPQGLYSFSNEVGLRYSLGPVELELAGRLSIPDDATAAPVTELSLGLQYALSQHTSLSAGFDLSSERQQYRFGITWRW